MANPATLDRKKSAIPPCPVHLIDLLATLGLLRNELETPVEAVDNIIWITDRIETLAGIRASDLCEAAFRLGDGGRLDGVPAESLQIECTRPQSDLRHISRPLRELDEDGTTEQLWRVLYRRWPAFRRVIDRVFPPRKTRGPKSKTNAGEIELVERWNRARASKIAKADFVADNRKDVSSVKKLNALLARIRMNKLRERERNSRGVNPE
jgi:hypothetical protein